MTRYIISLFLSLSLVCASHAQNSTKDNSTDLVQSTDDQLVQNMLAIIQSEDYSTPQREIVLEAIEIFKANASSPDFDPLQFEIWTSNLINSSTEKYQFIISGILLKYAFQILQPYYSSGDISNYNLHFLTTSLADYYISAKAYERAAPIIEATFEFCTKTGRTSGNQWVRNLFLATELFVAYNKIENAKSTYEEAMQTFIASPDKYFSPYTVNAMLRASRVLIGHVDLDTFKPVLDYLNSKKKLSTMNLAHEYLFRAKLLTQYFGNYKDAFKLYDRLLNSSVNFVGWQLALYDMMEAAWYTDKKQYAILSLMATHVGRDQILLTLNSFPLNFTESFWHSAAEQLNKGYGLGLNSDECSQFEFLGIFLNTVFTKTISLTSNRDVFDIIREKGEKVQKDILNNMLDIRHKMANTTDQNLRSRYNDELETLEMSLRSSMNLSWLGGEQHQKAMFMPRSLKNGECEVEILEYQCTSDTINPTHYGAIVCTSKPNIDKNIGIEFLLEHYEFVPLGPVMAWELLYNGLGNKTDRDRANHYSNNTLLTVAHLFSPLFQHFKENNLKKAYISPTGLLNVINIGALPWPYSDGSVNDNVEIVRINGAYDVENIKKRDASLKSALVFSNIDFNKANELENVKKSSSNEAISEIAGYRIKVEKGGNVKKFPRLPINENKLRQSINKGTSTIRHYSGENATEALFKEIDGNAPELLHIDTHGFYIPEGDQAYIGKHVIQGTRESALLTCGLALSGANKAWSGEDVEPGCEDGILTAWEISCMDLRGCKLAVLSACETAQGMLDNINGVMGLQRALKLAGVQAMLLTLWPVDNELTEEFINEFYSRLPDSANFNDAFIATQREFRKRHSDPYHWAPFILIN